MKFFNTGLIAVLIIAIGSLLFMESCKKEKFDEEINHNSPKIMLSQNHNGMQIFSSVEDYDAYLQEYDFSSNTHDPNSLYNVIEALNNQREENHEAYLANPVIADTIFDGYGALLDILNKDKIVQIGDYMYKVDLYDEMVHYINASEDNAYNVLVEETDSRIQSVPTSQDVLHDVNLAILPWGLWPWGCKEPRALQKKNKTYSSGCGRFRAKRELTYQKAGIYFALKIEIKNQKRRLRIWWRDYGATASINQISAHWTPRCRTTEYYSGYPSSGTPRYQQGNGKATYTLYNSSRSLKEYNVFAWLSGHCTNNVKFQLQS